MYRRTRLLNLLTEVFGVLRPLRTLQFEHTLNMGQMMTPEQRMAEIQAKRNKFYCGLTREEYLHIKGTWKDLTKFQRKSVKNPRFVERFVEKEAAFIAWSKANGYAFDRELELIGPFKRQGTRLVFKWEEQWVDGVRIPEREHRLFHAEDEEIEITPDHWVTDYRTLRWTKHTNLLRREGKFLLTSFGKKRIAAMHKSPPIFECFGERKSVAAWAADPRSCVSDKTIKKRLGAGYSVEEAITQPRGSKARNSENR